MKNDFFFFFLFFFKQDPFGSVPDISGSGKLPVSPWSPGPGRQTSKSCFLLHCFLTGKSGNLNPESVHGVIRLACFLSTTPVLCQVAIRCVDGGGDHSREKRTQRT